VKQSTLLTPCTPSKWRGGRGERKKGGEEILIIKNKQK